MLMQDHMDEVEAGPLEHNECQRDGRTPLDRTIDRIGMGNYQWSLLALCGFGWLADNMWIQTVAIALPRVQQHFNVSDGMIGTFSSSLFAGMMIGAVGWGSGSDLLGRSAPFNLTLLFTSLFGFAASFAPSFLTLCLALFLLGTSVGGSMPTDGTLLLEHVPKDKQYLVTALSVFFSFGSVLSAIVGVLIIPGHSCPIEREIPCDVETMNLGWRYFFEAIGFITLVFFISRIVLFRLHESPRYLVHAGRHEEALVSLRKISRFNGSELSIGLNDVRDHRHPECEGPENDGNCSIFSREGGTTASEVATSSDAGSPRSAETEPLNPEGSKATGTQYPPGSPYERPHYQATGSNETFLEEHTASGFPHGSLPEDEEDGASFVHEPVSSSETIRHESKGDSGHGTLSRLLASDTPTPRRRQPSRCERRPSLLWRLPRRIRQPLFEWLDKLALVLSPEWLRTTILVWSMWCLMSLAYTMFNVFLPKLLEMNKNAGGFVVRMSEGRSLEETMWEVVIFTIAGCPGALIGACMIESSFGRRRSLAASTFITALFCLVFVNAASSIALRLATIGISLSSTTMWAILYGWTPEIFDTAVRGTACGTASALSRIGGMIAPILGGALLMVSRSVPVYVSAVIFVVGGICTLLLDVERHGVRD